MTRYARNLARAALLPLIVAGCSKAKKDAPGDGSTVVASDLQVIEPALGIDPKFAPSPTSVLKKGMPVGVTWLEFSQDGKRLLVNSWKAKNGVQLWAVGETPSKVREWESRPGALSGDGRRVLVAPEGKPVIVVDPDTDQTIATTKFTGMAGNFAGGPSWSFSAPELLVEVFSTTGGGGGISAIRGYSSDSGKQLFDLPVRHGKTILHRSPLFNERRQVAVVYEKEDTVDVWDVTARQQVRQVKVAIPVADPSWGDAFVNSSGTLIAAQISGHGVFFRDGTTGAVVAQLPKDILVYRGAFVPGRDVFLTPSNMTREDKKGSSVEVVAFDIPKRQVVAVFRGGHAAGIDALAVSENGRWMATGDTAGQVRLWDLSKLR